MLSVSSVRDCEQSTRHSVVIFIDEAREFFTRPEEAPREHARFAENSLLFQDLPGKVKSDPRIESTSIRISVSFVSKNMLSFAYTNKSIRSY